MIIEEQTRNGLTSEEALERKEKFGPNKLPEKAGRKPIVIFFAQFKNPLIYIITVAAIISLLLLQFEDAIIIGVVIILDCVLGFFQEYRAEKTMQVLRKLLKPLAHVIRDGKVCEIEITEIVPDDIITLHPGDRVAADGEIIEAINLGINEAILTGESEPIIKKKDDKVYMGTTILSGRGVIKVSATGLNTQLGKIAGSLAEIKDEETPLQLRLNAFGKTLTYLVLIISISIFTIGIILGFNIFEMIRLSVVLAIAAIPEGLIIAVTMILAIGMRIILRRKGLVKKLLAVETLGSVSTICTDKTGTLTEGIMKVVRTDFRFEKEALNVMSLCNDLEDSLEICLWAHVESMKTNPQDLFDKYPRLYEIPFSSENKYMLTVNKIEETEIGFLKGAPEIIMDFCNLTDQDKEELIKELEAWSAKGLKVLGLAYKNTADPQELVGYTWIGFVGIEDPIRPSVKDAIALCRRAGIKIKMITGDYRKTAETVARDLGLAVGSDQVIEGRELEVMSEQELIENMTRLIVFCRVSPHHKMKIVNALQSCGEITAMIGDGVNDAPALKKANIGVSVGNATDVAQETASLILLDNNFNTLVNSVEEGRIIFDNIKKVVAYVLSNSFAEIFVIFGAFILGWPVPLTIAQILWIHLICDGPADISLGFERGERGIMDAPPRDINESILDVKGRSLIICISIGSGMLCLILFYIFWQLGNVDLGRTFVFAILGVQSLIYIFSYRSLHNSIFKSGNFFSNKVLIGSVILGLSQIITGLYIPGLNSLLGVVPLDFGCWLIVLGVSFSMVFLVELVKYLDKKLRKSPLQQVFKIMENARSKIPEINNLHNISVDIMKDKILLQFHFDVPIETPLEAAHDIATRIETRLQEDFPIDIRRNLEIISHLEPERPPAGKIHSHGIQPVSSNLRQIVEEAIKRMPEVKGWNHLNIIEEHSYVSISLTVYLDGNVNITEAHHATEELEADIRKSINRVKRCIIHSEPYSKL
ncbi:MAG: HAD family hydrolase [Candidatus Lokiarchaeota archaeon]|nr:HAD family hydrolase [Candidatus Lokiarchaeota archaeon]